MANKKLADLDIVVSTHLAAEILNTSQGNLRRMRSEGIGPSYIKHNSNVLYRIADLSEYARSFYSLRNISELAMEMSALAQDSSRMTEVLHG